MFSAVAYGIGGLVQLSRMRQIQQEGKASNPAAIAKLREVSSKVTLIAAILDMGGGTLCVVAAVLIHPVQVLPLSLESSYVLYVVGAVSLGGGVATCVATLVVRRRQAKYAGPDPRVVTLPNPNIKYTGPVIQRIEEVGVPGRVIERVEVVEVVDPTLPEKVREREYPVIIPGPVIEVVEYEDNQGIRWVKPEEDFRYMRGA